jgi:hypothetical protein
LDGPVALAFDRAGFLYAANPGTGRISKITPDGTRVTTFASGFAFPEGLAFDSSGNLYVANNGDNTISKVTEDGTGVTTFARGFNQPVGLAFDTSGNLYVANAGSATISKVTPDGTGVSTFASVFNDPIGLSFDNAGNLYVANSAPPGSISEVTPDGTVATFASAVDLPTWLVAAQAPTLTPPADITTGPCEQPVHFAATATGYPNPAITYSIPGPDGNPMTITSPYSFPAGQTTVTCTALNSAGSQSSTFNVDNNGTPSPPAAGPSALAATEGQTASLPVAAVLAGASSPGGGALTIQGTPYSSSGVSVTLDSVNGIITYGAAAFTGSDTIYYTLSDGCGSATGTIVVTIGASGSPPSAAQQAGPAGTATVALPPNPSQGGLTATLNNNGAGSQNVNLTANTYASDPVPGAGTFNFGPQSAFLDLEAPGAATGDSMTAYFYYPYSSPTAPTLQYYNSIGNDWVAVYSDAPPPTLASAVPTQNQYWQYLVIFDDFSTPKITELTGTVFALATTAVAPTLSCPANIEVYQDPGQCGAQVTFSAPSATGFPTPTVTCLLNGIPIASPCEFPVGVSTVYCTAANSAGSQACSFTVTVLEINPPVAGAFAISPKEGTPESVPVAKMLLVDKSPGGGPLSIASVTSPTGAGGTVALGGGLLTYTPAANYVGADTINYLLSDGCGTVPGIVSVTVVSANAPPLNGLTIQMSGGNAILQFHGIPGQWYYIQSAPTCLGPWTDLPGTPVQANSLGLIAYTVAAPSSPSFFRTSTNP